MNRISNVCNEKNQESIWFTTRDDLKFIEQYNSKAIVMFLKDRCENVQQKESYRGLTSLRTTQVGPELTRCFGPFRLENTFYVNSDFPDCINTHNISGEMLGVKLKSLVGQNLKKIQNDA